MICLLGILNLVPLIPAGSTEDDWEIDQILSQIPDPANVCLQIPYTPWPQLTPSTPMSRYQSTPSTRFAKPISDQQLNRLKKNAIPANTQKSTS